MKLKIIIKGPECLYNYNVISPHPYKIFYFIFLIKKFKILCIKKIMIIYIKIHALIIKLEKTTMV